MRFGRVAVDERSCVPTAVDLSQAMIDRAALALMAEEAGLGALDE